jgi:hypothetical protein
MSNTPLTWHHVVRAVTNIRQWNWNVPDTKVKESVTLVDPFFGVAHATPLDRVLVDLPAEIGVIDLMVLRGVTYDEVNSSRVSTEELQHRLTARFGEKPAIAVLDFEPGVGLLPRLTLRPLIGRISSSLDVLERWLRAMELQSQLDQTGAIYRPHDMHFQLPSGVHADAYIRVADAFDNITIVSRLADWLQHRLTPGTVLLSDTWTTLPLLQELVYRLSRASEGVSPEATAERIISFPEYPTFSQIRQTLNSIPPLVSGHREPKVLFLVSVISSGELLRTLRSLITDHLPNINLDIVALINTAKPTVDVDSFAAVDNIKRYDVSRQQCKLCLESEKRPVVLIDRRRYFPEFQAEHRPIMLTPRFAQLHHWFWETASQAEAIRVHVDEPLVGGVGTRHLHVWMDIRQLLKNSDLAHKVRLKLAEFAPDTDLVLIPEHPCTEELFIQASRVFPSADIKRVDRSTLSTTLRGVLTALLPQKQRILIFDDAAISGRTLKSLHRLVQDVAHEVAPHVAGSPNYIVRGFVVVARPSRADVWTHLQDSFRQEGAAAPFLDCSFLIPLPTECAWCQEEQFLVDAERVILSRTRRGDPPISERSQRTVRERIRRLQSARTSGGLAESLFICDRAGFLVGPAADWLSPNSLFGQGLSETAAYGAVCTAMHAIRYDKKTAGTQGISWYWDAVRILNAYHDPILQASFLRVARREELQVPHRVELLETIRTTLFDFVNDDLRQSAMVVGEHALAASMEKYGTLLIGSVVDSCSEIADSWNSDLRYLVEAFTAYHAMTR